MKDDSKSPRILRGFALLICITAVVAGCANSSSNPPGSGIPADAGLLEAACEDDLQYLAKIIKELSAGKGTDDAVLIEAMEIYRMAESLYLQKEFKLASELIENAVKRLKESGE